MEAQHSEALALDLDLVLYNDIEAPKALDVQLAIIDIVVSEAKSLEREYWQKRKLLHGRSMGIYAR